MRSIRPKNCITFQERYSERLADWQRLGGDVCAVIMGYDVERYAQELIYQGADKVYVVDDELFRDYNNELYTKALEKIVREHDPAIMLFGSVFDRRDLAPRLAARLGTGIISECGAVGFDDSGRLTADKVSDRKSVV